MRRSRAFPGWLLVLVGLLLAGRAAADVNVTSVTLSYAGQNSHSSISVPPGASITVTVNVTITSAGPPGQNRWRATFWSIGSTSGCYDNANHDGAGSYSETFTITAPSSAGSYTATVAIDCNGCGGGGQVASHSKPGGIVVDSGAPTVSTIVCAEPAACGPSNPTRADPLKWTVTFSESVSGVDTSDFALVATGTAGGSISQVTGSGSSYTVVVSSIAGAGTLQLDLIDNDSITDAAGNKLGGTGTGNGSYSGPSYTVDHVGPTATLSCSAPCGPTNPTSATTLQWQVTFDESVSGVGLDDFALVASGTSGTLQSLSGSGASYTVTVAGVSGSGTLGLNLVDDDSIVDSLGNKLGGMGAGTGNVTGPSYTINQITLDRFDAVTPGAASLYTRLVGVPFAIEIRALDASNAMATGFTGDVAVELVEGSGGSACEARAQRQDLGTQRFAASDQGRLTLNTTVPTAWRALCVRVSHTDAGTTTVACSSDSFSVRPQGFTLASSANADASGTSAAATPVVKAGAAFTLTATAALGYDGTPTLGSDSALWQAHASATAKGSLNGSFAAADPASGVSSGVAFRYGEVGYVRLLAGAVYDDSFTAVDQGGDCSADFSNALVNDKYGCKFANADSDYFGRFIPDHFDLMLTPSCGGGLWTYSGQPFVLSVVARNGETPTAQTTANYAGAFVKPITISDDGDATAGFSHHAPANLTFTAGIGSSPAISAADALRYTFISPPQLPTTLRLRARDSDGVSSVGFIEPQAEFRSGRLRLINAVGSIRAPIDVPMRVETYQTVATGIDAWAVESSDTCTALLPSNFSLVGSATIDAVSLSNGSGHARLSSTTAGSVTLTAEIATLAPWLQFDWTGSGVQNPSARVSFELKAGNDRQIFRD